MPISQRGFTLLELLISLALSGFVISMGVILWQLALKSNNEILLKQELDQALFALLDGLRHQVIRSGYQERALNTSKNHQAVAKLKSQHLCIAPQFGESCSEPKCEALENGRCRQWHSHGRCLVFTYDADRQGQPLYFAYRLQQGKVQMRFDRLVSTDPRSGCIDGSWQSQTNPSIQFTKLDFRLQSRLHPERQYADRETSRTKASQLLNIHVRARWRAHPEIWSERQIQIRLPNQVWMTSP